MQGFRQYRQDGCLSYLLFDLASKELAVVDPRADLMEDYRSFIAENRLKPTVVFDTRLHTHHLSGSHLFAAEYGAPVAMSARAAGSRATRKLSTGQVVALGADRIEVFETPGVSEDAICLRYGDALLTGDTLWIDVPASLDGPGASADSHRKSLGEVLGSLPDLAVFPGHERGGVLFSTLDVERRRNPDFNSPDREIRSASRADGQNRKRLEFNSIATPAANHESQFGIRMVGLTPASQAESQRRVASINVEKLVVKVREQAKEVCFLDVRETDEFARGHMPGALNVPLSLLAFHLEELRRFKRVYVSCETGRRSILAAQTLDYLGFPDVVNVSGGYKSWKTGGFSE